MKQDFTALQYIDIPANLEMISGPVSYDKYSIHNNNQVLKEIQIFGDVHFSEHNNCTEQGEKCIYVTKDGIIHDGTKEEVNCVDIPTYLGYAILDAHTQHKYTDIYIEASQKEAHRLYDIGREDELWNAGYLIKTQLFLKPCGTSIDRHPLCRDSPNGERNYARVHSGDIRSDMQHQDFRMELIESFGYDKFTNNDSGMSTKNRSIQVLTYLLDNIDEFIFAFTEDDLGYAIRRIFLPFYEIVSEKENKQSSIFYPLTEIKTTYITTAPSPFQKYEKEQYIKNNYPFIHIMLREFGGYYKTQVRSRREQQQPTFSKIEERGSSLLKRKINEGKDIFIHRVGKTYSKVLDLKNKYKEYELSHILVQAYENFVVDLKSDAKDIINFLINNINNTQIPITYDENIKLKQYTAILLIRIFAPLYDIYTIGRMISYTESQRMIYYAGDWHCKILKNYIEKYVYNEILRINKKYNTSYSINQNAHVSVDPENVDRCIR